MLNIFFYSFLLSLITFPIHAAWFQNQAQQAETAFKQENYAEAAELFDNAYQQGVALYRDKQFKAAAAAFERVDTPQLRGKAQYNLGNAYFQQGQHEQAIKAYNEAEKLYPEKSQAIKANRALAEKMQQKEQNQQDSQQSNDQKQQPEQENAKNQEKSSSEQTPQNSEQYQTQQQADSEQETSKSKNNSSTSQQMTDEETKKAVEQAQSTEENKDNVDGENEAKDAVIGVGTNSQAIPNEKDVMADVLLNRLQENPQQLLKNQFYIDSRMMDAPPPKQTW